MCRVGVPSGHDQVEDLAHPPHRRGVPAARQVVPLREGQPEPLVAGSWKYRCNAAWLAPARSEYQRRLPGLDTSSAPARGASITTAAVAARPPAIATRRLTTC
jgi:hypothetical protein